MESQQGNNEGNTEDMGLYWFCHYARTNQHRKGSVIKVHTD